MHSTGVLHGSIWIGSLISRYLSFVGGGVEAGVCLGWLAGFGPSLYSTMCLSTTIMRIYAAPLVCNMQHAGCVFVLSVHVHVHAGLVVGCNLG
jgi:hypothetical protein